MITQCSSCGASLPAGAGRCPQCLAIVKPPGFWERLREMFKVQITVNTGTASAFKVKATVNRRFTIRDPATGESKVYHSLEEVPEKYREQLGKALGTAGLSADRRIKFTGPDGVTHTYNSLAEVPPEIRALIERGANKAP